MCVEVVKSMALKPTRSITGAMVSVRAVSTPSAAQRHWLPSRSEVSTSLMSAMGYELHSREEGRVDTTRLELGVRQYGGVKRQVGSNAGDPGRGDRLLQARERGRPVIGMGNDLGHQGVVERRDTGARGDVCVDTDALSGRPGSLAHEARTRAEIIVGIFGVHAAFDRTAPAMNVGLREPQAGAIGNGNLLGNEIDSRDRLGDRVLHLDAGIHFQ